MTFSNNHYYIGQAVDTNRRFSQHKRELKKGVHSNSRLQNCFNKYGEPKFEVIHECTKEELNSIETKYLFEHVDNELCCNMCREGCSPKGVVRTDEYKSESAKLEAAKKRCVELGFLPQTESFGQCMLRVSK